MGGDWSRSVLWFGDDRAVPPDDENSNYGMAKAALLDHVDARVERIEGELGPDEAAERYTARLREHFGDDAVPVARSDPARPRAGRALRLALPQPRGVEDRR